MLINFYKFCFFQFLFEGFDAPLPSIFPCCYQWQPMLLNCSEQELLPLLSHHYLPLSTHLLLHPTLLDTALLSARIHANHTLALVGGPATTANSGLASLTSTPMIFPMESSLITFSAESSMDGWNGVLDESKTFVVAQAQLARRVAWLDPIDDGEMV